MLPQCVSSVRQIFELWQWHCDEGTAEIPEIRGLEDSVEEALEDPARTLSCSPMPQT